MLGHSVEFVGPNFGIFGGFVWVQFILVDVWKDLKFSFSRFGPVSG